MTGRRVWWYFVAFFGFVAAVNAAMVTTALRTHSGTVTEHPYEKGLAYNDVVKATEKQAALGWTSRLEFTRGALFFSVRDAKNQPLSLEKATASFTRPAQSGMDFVVELTGRETPITFPAKGQWEVRVDAMHKGVPYQESKRIVAP